MFVMRPNYPLHRLEAFLRGAEFQMENHGEFYSNFKEALDGVHKLLASVSKELGSTNFDVRYSWIDCLLEKRQEEEALRLIYMHGITALKHGRFP